MRPALADAVELGPAHVRGRLYDLGPYPAAVLVASEAEEGAIHGVLLDVAAAALPVLDEYEAVHATAPAAGLYRRVLTEAQLAAAARPRHPCWIYVWARGTPPGRRVESGIWQPAPRR